jgi:hypothetical protein
MPLTPVIERRALQRRDGGCRFPGCDTSVRAALALSSDPNYSGWQ